MDHASNLKKIQVLDPVTLTADVDCTGVDMQAYEDVSFYVLVGESGDTLSGSVMIELEVEESADDSTYTDCADADLSSSVTGTNTGTFAVIDAAAEDDAVFQVQYYGDKRYVRVVVNVTGTHSNGTPIGAISLQTPKYLPVA